MKRKSESTSLVYETMGVPLLAGSYFGLEVELEYNGEFDDGFDVGREWKIVGEGSLRRGVEFVSAPQNLEETAKSIEKLQKRIEKHRDVIDYFDSPRAGVHIHVNMTDKTILQLSNAVFLYYVLEQVIVDNAGKDRAGNLFCLRLCDASSIKRRLRYLPDAPRGLYTDGDLRYSALNFDSLFRFGTLEWRALRTPMDFRSITPWVKIMHSIFRVDRFKSPEEILKEVSIDGARRFARKILGDEFVLVENTPDMEEKIQEGVWDVQDVVFTKEWS